MSKWRAWEFSTGPRTEAGKAIASQNAVKTGLHSAQFRAVRKELARLSRERRTILKAMNNPCDSTELLEILQAGLTIK
jgi:hypothetical protein